MTTSLPNNVNLYNLFPSSIYSIKRDLIVIEEEKKEIEDIMMEMREGGNETQLDYLSENTYIFDTKLKNLKEFCEQHIKIYGKELLNPKEKIDFYITQSWLNMIKPGGHIQKHYHENSIISGVFYISTVEDDKLLFHDPNHNRVRCMIKIQPKEPTLVNGAYIQAIEIDNGILLLFPSWLEHNVPPNLKATTNRISISFNVFAKGNFGMKGSLSELTLPDPR